MNTVPIPYPEDTGSLLTHCKTFGSDKSYTASLVLILESWKKSSDTQLFNLCEHFIDTYSLQLTIYEFLHQPLSIVQGNFIFEDIDCNNLW